MPTQVFAHRGSSFHHAEQSRESFIAAIEEGADGLECDVRLSSDRVAFCWHDRDIFRLTGKKSSLSKMTSKEIASLKIIDQADPARGTEERHGTPIALEELAALAADAKVKLLIETKHPVLTGAAVEEEVARIVKRFKVEVHLLSFSFTAISRAYKLLPQSEPVQLIQHAPLLPLAQSKIIGIDIELIRKDRRVIDDLLGREKEIFVYTVNDDEEFKYLSNAGVSGIITDIPTQAKRVLGYP